MSHEAEVICQEKKKRCPNWVSSKGWVERKVGGGANSCKFKWQGNNYRGMSRIHWNINSQL